MSREPGKLDAQSVRHPSTFNIQVLCHTVIRQSLTTNHSTHSSISLLIIYVAHRFSDSDRLHQGVLLLMYFGFAEVSKILLNHVKQICI